MTAAFATLRQSKQMTIMLADDLDVPAILEHETNTLWVRTSEDDDDIAYLVDWAVRETLRPTLTEVSASTLSEARPEKSAAPRPKLRLVRAGGDR